MNIIPVGDRVLLKPIIEEEKSESGLILTKVNDTMEIVKGKVLALGDDMFVEGSRLPEKLKVGSEIIYIKCSATELMLEAQGGVLNLLRYADIMAILENDQDEKEKGNSSE